jgi:protein arginine kinase
MWAKRPSERGRLGSCHNPVTRCRMSLRLGEIGPATCSDGRDQEMNLDSLMRNTGEWLRGTGPESDIVISTRIRLARNLTNYPFTNRATTTQKAEIEARLRDTLTRLDSNPRLQYVNVLALNPLDRQMLVERQLMSRALANAEGPRGVAFDERESVSVMINEEDHLRLQVMRSGLALDDAWGEIDRLDDQIEALVNYAFHEQFGYLTACPTNVGTGMRASVMMHLPGIYQSKQLDKVVRSLQKINLVVRGLYGEGSRAFGEFYQISNQVTLGKSETQALTEIRDVILTTIQWETQGPRDLVAGQTANSCKIMSPRGPGHLAIGDHDDQRRDDGATIGRALGHPSATDGTM